MSRELPLVSVVIPVYNGAKTLAETLNSVFNQSYRNKEVIVIDDGSMDNIADVVQPFLDKINFIRKENGGLASARNLGHETAKGDYIAWLDSDDLAHPDRLAIQTTYMESHPDVVLACSDFSAFDENGRVSDSYINDYYDSIKANGGLDQIFTAKEEFNLSIPENNVDKSTSSVTIYNGNIREKLVMGNFIHPPTVMLRRSVILKAGELDMTIPTAEDWDYILRISKYGDIAYIDFPLLDYRLSENQLSSSLRSGRKIINGIFRVMEKVKEDDPWIVENNLQQFNERMAKYHTDAAYFFSELERAKAIKHLYQSIRYKLWQPKIAKIAVKIIFPSFVLEMFRKTAKQ